MRNSRPRNPQTEKQMVSRLCLKVLNNIYSALSPICGHSFEGCTGESQNRAEFMRLNLPILQQSAANFLNTGSNSPLVFWPTFKEGRPLVGAEFIISQGSLSPAIYVATQENIDRPFIFFTNPNNQLLGTGVFDGSSYSSFASSCGLKVGDQITFISLWTSSFLNVSLSPFFICDVQFQRIVLFPGSGNPDSTPFWDSNGVIVNPNERNSKDISFTLSEVDPDFPLSCNSFTINNWLNNSLMGVIVSRKVNGKWLRSSSSFLWSPYCAADSAGESNIQTPYPFSSLLEEFTAKATIGSEEYLNNATE